MKECENFLSDFCLKNIGDARVWNCTCKSKIRRIKECYKLKQDFLYNCPFCKIGVKNEK